MDNSIKIFIAFDNKDIISLQELKKHLKPLELQGLISVWDTSQIVGGTDWQQAINSHLETASIILLLISANFMASTSAYDLGKRAVAKSALPNIVVIPILLHEVDWESSEYGPFAPLPANRKPISSWQRRDVAYTEIVKNIRTIITEMPTTARAKSLTHEHPQIIEPAPQQIPAVTHLALSQKEAFDVFLCYNSKDRGEVRKIAGQLKIQGIFPWFDEWELQPGLPWQRALEQQIGQIKSAAVFVGERGLGPWQNMEVDALLREFVKRGCPVIPVLLKTTQEKPELPLFLAGMTWVDFHIQEPDPMRQLIWGINARKPANNTSSISYDPPEG